MKRPLWLVFAAIGLLWGVGETSYRDGYSAGPRNVVLQEPHPQKNGSAAQPAVLILTPDELELEIIEVPPFTVFHEPGWEYSNNQVKQPMKVALKKGLTPCPQCVVTLIQKRRRDLASAHQLKSTSARRMVSPVEKDGRTNLPKGSSVRLEGEGNVFQQGAFPISDVLKKYWGVESLVRSM